MKIQKKIVNIAEIILELNKQQKGKRIRILISKQILQRLPISFAQVKTGNTSENLLSEIRKIIYFLYWEKAVTRKVYINIMNLVGL